MTTEKTYNTKTTSASIAAEPDYSAQYTARDYLSWTFDGLFELIKGKAWKMAAAPNSLHAKIDINLLRGFLQAFPKGSCQVFTAPFDVFLSHENEPAENATTVVQPDICVVCEPAKIEEKGCVGAPDLVVEILSPTSAKKDLNDKYNVYEAFGVKEYWVVFPADKAINIFSLVEGKFELHQSYGKTDILQSPLFEQLHFAVNEIFE